MTARERFSTYMDPPHTYKHVSTEIIIMRNKQYSSYTTGKRSEACHFPQVFAGNE